MSDVTKLFIFTAATFILVVVIGTEFYWIRKGVNELNESNSELIELSSNLQKSLTKKIDKEEFSGSDVINYIQMYHGTIPMVVATINNSGFYEFDSIYDTKSDTYIHPNAEFIGNVIKTTNGNPSGDPSEIENLKDSVSALSASLIALSEEIAGMKNNQATKDDLDTINNSISSIQSTLNILKDKIDSLTEEGAKPTPTDTPNSKSISEKSSGFVKMISDSSEIAEEGDTWVIGDNVKARVENNCLYVTGNGSTFRFTSRNAVPWYHLAPTITKVKIDSSVDVKYLDWWFSKTSIKNIILPDSVISLIGTFYDCTKLEKCSFIPASVQVMDYCFYNCNQLKGNIDCLSDFVHSMSNFYTGKDLSISVSADTVSFRTMEEYCLNNSERGVSIVGK